MTGSQPTTIAVPQRRDARCRWLLIGLWLSTAACGQSPFEINALTPSTDPVCCGTCCFIDDSCWLEGAAHPENDCWICDPQGSGGPFAWSDTTGACDDHNGCTDDDLCAGGICEGTPRLLGDTCDDQDPCTHSDSCTAAPLCLGMPVDCSAASTICSYGTCDAQTGACLPTPYAAGQGCADWGTDCDGFRCDGQGACGDPQEQRCAVEGHCVAEATPHPEEACLVCAPERSTYGWSPRAAGTPCGPSQRCDETVDGPVLRAATLCDEGGACVRGEVGDCGAFAYCDGDGIRCASLCANDADCISEARCVDGVCLGQRLLGEPCSDDGQCVSLACIDEVCCTPDCDAACLGCHHALTAAADGTCAPILAGLDPHDDCPAEAPESCGFSGTCAGDGSCANHGTEAVCDELICDGFNQLIAWRCDGSGTCLESGPESCAPGICRDAACDLDCAGDQDCAAGAHCAWEESVTTGQCSDANRPPVADLTGPREGLGNVPLVLDASGSVDPDDDPLTYTYTQLIGPLVALVPEGDTALVLPPAVSNAEEVIIEVVVNDGALDSEPAVHVFTVHLVPAGCLCSGGRGTPLVWLPLLAVLALRRRRYPRR